ncbi:hypothetical protein [Sulfobacillus harzensis]|uniref:Uncharacterized protein n=1 Tax=Sulfobacillus harzensis TaxID=2729629 RepID=A0A7Y0LAN2_9FIRM|nr:hypothetical protein [Sulfobacillus harzensis]NMP24939.1 hypothetical protein [Sulfobacillus harzensis]
MNTLSETNPTFTIRDLNDAAALAEELVTLLPVEQQDKGRHVAQAFDYALAMMDEMQRRLRLSQVALNELASKAVHTANDVNPASLALWPPF